MQIVGPSEDRESAFIMNSHEKTLTSKVASNFPVRPRPLNKVQQDLFWHYMYSHSFCSDWLFEISLISNVIHHFPIRLVSFVFDVSIPHQLNENKSFRVSETSEYLPSSSCNRATLSIRFFSPESRSLRLISRSIFAPSSLSRFCFRLSTRFS